MPTLRGSIFALVHIAILTAGLLRDELGTVVWGAGFLLIQLVVSVFALIGRSRLRALAGRFTCELDRRFVDEGEGITVSVDPPFARIIPGFHLRHEIDLRWESRVLWASSDVEPGRRAEWTFIASERGDFRGDASMLALVDVFGFTRSTIRDAHQLRLLVVPPPADERPALPVRLGGERAVEHSAARVRSDELREVRPYVPGDDTRRLSWKHLAAHDELLLRIGELVPPFRGEVVCAIDPWVPHDIAPERVGDALMRALRTLAAEAQRRDVLLSCRFPGSQTPIVIAGPARPDDTEGGEAYPPSLAAIAGFVTARARDVHGDAGGRRPAPDVHGISRGDSTDGVSPVAGGPGANVSLVISARPEAPGFFSVAPMLVSPVAAAPLWRRLLVREPA